MTKNSYIIGYIKKRKNPDVERWYFKLIDKEWEPKGSVYEKTSKYKTPIRGMIIDMIENREENKLIMNKEYSIEDIYDLFYRKIIVLQAFEENKLTGKMEWMKSSIGKLFTEDWEGLINEPSD